MISKKLKVVTFLFIFLPLIKANAINLDFSDSALISCNQSDNDQGKYCIYNVASGIYAKVTLVREFNADVTAFDDNNYGEDKAFQPIVVGIANKNWGYGEFKITFWKDSSATQPLYIDQVLATAVDVDGDGAGNEKEGAGFFNFISYTLEANTNLDRVEALKNNNLYRFSSTNYTNQSGIDYTKTENMVSVLYKKVHTIVYRAYVYNNLDSGSTSGRLFSIYFGDSYNGNPFPNWSNPQTTTVGVNVSGRIIEDVNGDAQIQSTDIGINNLTVYAYMDDGDSIPEDTETVRYKEITGEYNGEEGFYSFIFPINKTYWIAVNSKSISPSAGLNSGFSKGDVWAEQTYGGNYVLCDTDADSSTAPVQLTQGGACFGGRNGDRSDGFYDGSYKLSQAEHLAKIDANSSDITDVDFGFSFNVVTNINDQDDDSDNNRTCQGCLRQFIQNANAISGPNTMRFVPAVPLNESNWWKIVLNMIAGTATGSDDYSLPPITDSYTTIDGTAYDYTDGISVRDTNTGTSGHSGEKVGAGPDGLENTGDEAQLPSYNKPELEIDLDDRGHGITIQASNTTIKNIAIQHSGDDKPDTALIRVETGTGNLIEGCFIGAKADGSNPNTISRLGINTFYGSTTDIRNNYIAYLSNTGIQMEGEGVVEYNDVYNIGYLTSCGDGISTEFIHNSSGTRSKSNLIFRYNRIENTAAYGIDTWKYPGAMTASNNTIFHTGQGDKDGNLCGNSSTGFEQGGIRVFGIGNEVKENLIHDVPGNGVVIVSVGGDTKQNLITKNVFYNTGGLSIDIDLSHTSSSDNPNGDGVTPNNGTTDNNKINIEMDYPVITTAEIANNTLHIVGYVGISSQKVAGSHRIEVYKADDDGNNNGEIEQGDGKSVAHGDGRYYLGSCTTSSDGTFDCSISNSNVSLSNGDLITATATDANNNTSEFGADAQVQPAASVKIISGHIYEDVNGDGDLSDKQPIENVTVKLYKLDGTEIGTAITNANGEFSFSVSTDGDYYVAVDSKSISPTAGFNSGYDQSYVWAEQTYGPAGSYCDTDANSSTAPTITSKNGVCFGGKNGDKSDGLNDGNGNFDFTKAEHVAKVTVSGGNITGLDFGFSFNVVTNINDQDDDPNNSRTCQGCFRQFIQNANAISGSNTLRFVPVVQPNKTNYWSITADKRMSDTDSYSTDSNEPIFRVKDTYTIIDGTAYDYKNGKVKIDKNSSSWAGEVVGYINTCRTGIFLDPELEIFTNARYPNDNNEDAAWDPYNNGEAASIFYVTGDNFTLRNIAAYGGHYVVFIDDANNPTIKDNFLGIPATGLSDPGDGKRSNRGVAVATQNQSNVINGLIEHNLIGYTRLHGIFAYRFDGQNNFIITKNKIVYPSKGWNHENGIGLEEGTQRIKVYCNEVSNSCGVGIETWKSIGKHIIESNTVKLSGLACAENSGSEEKIGIRITSSNNIIRYNKITNNLGPGLMVAYDSGRGFSPKRNLISKNYFKNNQKVGIDLLKDGENSDGLYISGQSGVTPNNGQKDTDIGNEGIDYPVFTTVTLSGNNLHLEGYIGTQNSKLKPQSGKTWTIEIYKADDDGNNNGEIEEGDGKSVAHGEGYEYLGSITLSDADFDSNDNFSKDLTVSGLNVGDKITAITIDNDNNTSEFSADIEITSSNAIFGYVYHDGYNPDNQSFLKPNGNKDSYEDWKDKATAPTIYIKLCDNDGTVIDVKQVSDGDGFFKFDNIPNGNYVVIEDTDNNTNNCSPSDPSQWISTTPNSVNVSINGNSVNVNFGDFHGSKVSGYVFEDKGNGEINSTDANNALFNSSVEKGIKDVEVLACQTEDCSTVLTDTLTTKNGKYVLYIPYNSTYEGKTLYIVEKDKTGYTSTGNTKGNTSAYKNPDNAIPKERNVIDFIVNSGNTYANYNFGDVKSINLQPEHSYTVPSGSSLTILHTITVNSPGKIAVSLSSDRNLAYLVYDDANCDGVPDGSPINPQNSKYTLNDGNPISADTNYCIVIKTVIPTDIQDGSVDKLEITTYEDWINTDSNKLDDNDLIQDTITISNKINGLIYLEKVVRNISQNESYTKRNQAKPCEILEYKISFKNIGSRKVKELVISDNIPIETRFNYASYNGDDVKLVFKNSSYTGKVSDNPDTDGIVLENNILKVNVNKIIGKQFIEPGEEGYILYQVIIKGNACKLTF